MEKSFYYTAQWTEVIYLRETLISMNIPFTIEQNDRLKLAIGEVAFIFPDLPIRVYGNVYKLFGNPGRRFSK